MINAALLCNSKIDNKVFQHKSIFLKALAISFLVTSILFGLSFYPDNFLSFSLQPVLGTLGGLILIDMILLYLKKKPEKKEEINSVDRKDEIHRLPSPSSSDHSVDTKVSSSCFSPPTIVRSIDTKVSSSSSSLSSPAVDRSIDTKASSSLSATKTDCSKMTHEEAVVFLKNQFSDLLFNITFEQEKTILSRFNDDEINVLLSYSRHPAIIDLLVEEKRFINSPRFERIAGLEMLQNRNPLRHAIHNRRDEGLIKKLWKFRDRWDDQLETVGRSVFYEIIFMNYSVPEYVAKESDLQGPLGAIVLCEAIKSTSIGIVESLLKLEIPLHLKCFDENYYGGRAYRATFSAIQYAQKFANSADPDRKACAKLVLDRARERGLNLTI